MMILTDDLVASAIIFLLAFILATFYSMTLLAMCKIWRETKNHFYLLLICLGFCDTTMLLIFAFYSAPSTLIQRPLYGRQFEILMLGFLCNATYFSGLAIQINMAANRYWSICRRSAYNAVFDLHKIIVSICACFCFGILSAVAQLTPCCSMRYYEAEYTWGYDTESAGNSIFVWYDRLLNLVTIIVLSIFYSLIFHYIRNSRRNSMVSNHSSSNQEMIDRNLAVQTSVIALFIFLAIFFFTVVPLFTSSKWCSLFISAVYISTLGVHPFVYIRFNRSIREKHVLASFRCFQPSTPEMFNNRVNVILN